MSDSYHFVSHWRVRADAAEVYDIIHQPLEYPRWWPSVYLSARQSGPDRRVSLHTRGWLPYTLRWDVWTTEAVPAHQIVVQAAGDFNGTGIWTFTQDGAFVDITFDWKLTVAKPLLRYLTPFLRPAFEANHRWAMEQGEASLREELIRYRARTPGDLLDAADPRGPVEVPVRWIAAGALAVSVLACIAVARCKSRKNQPAALA